MYRLRKAPNRDLYWVVAIDGTKKSKEPIPLERAKAQMRALYSAMSLKGEGKEVLEGSGSKPSKSIFQKIGKAAYETNPTKDIDGFILSLKTKTLKIYVNQNVGSAIVGIRGTFSGSDLVADAKLTVNQLESSSRFKTDLKELEKFKRRFPNYDYYGVGHSLGGAILDAFIKRGLIKSGVSYNPAVETKNLRETIDNERIYNEDDALGKLYSPLLKDKPEIRKTKNKSMIDRAVELVPYLGTVYKHGKAHSIENFEGGRLGKYHSIEPSAYLKEAQRKAEHHGYPSKLLGFARDGIHKLAIPDENGKIIRFGRLGYGDNIIYEFLEKNNMVTAGTAEKKKNVFHKSHSKIKGSWRENPFSPNNLALRILW